MYFRRADDPTAPGKPAFHSLYEEAFRRFAAHALWSMRQLRQPSRDDALNAARALRIEGNLAARQLAERLEEACRAPH